MLIAALAVFLGALATLTLSGRTDALVDRGADGDASPQPAPWAEGAAHEGGAVAAGERRLRRPPNLADPTHELTGTVVEAASGQPVRCFAIACSAGAGDRAGPGLRQDAEGRFRIRGLPSGRYTVAVEVGESRSRRTVLHGIQVPRSEPLVVPVDTGPRIAGRIVDGQSRPVANIEVSAATSGDPERRTRSRTDLEGRFVLTGVEAGDYQLSVEHWVGWSARVHVPAGGTGMAELRLPAASSLRVAASDAQGAPMAGAQLLLWSREGTLRRGHTEPDGTARVMGLPPGAYTLHVSHADCRAEQRTIEVGGAQDRAVGLAMTRYPTR